MENMNLPSLTDLCMKTIYETLKFYLECSLENKLLKPSIESRNGLNYSEIHFKNHIFLPEPVSEKLVTILSSNGILNDHTISLFDRENTYLRRLKIPDASNLNLRSLKILRKHQLKELKINKINVSLNSLIESLGEWTQNNLEVLNVSQSSLMDPSKMYLIFVNLSKLKKLKELDVSYTEFNSHNLEIIVDDLPNLESLNISDTRVDNISPLKKCRSRLKKLMMANLKVSSQNFPFNPETCNDVLLNLNKLRHLDVSFDKNNVQFDIIVAPEKRHTFKIIDSMGKLPNLVSLDISGQEDVSETSLVKFLQKHPNLTFLGLMSLDVCNSKVFTNPCDPDYRPDLKITGTGSVEQVILGMKLYKKRINFIQGCLYSLYVFSEHDRLGPRPDIIELVTKQMKRHSDVYNIQLASTACLYNLTKCGLLESYEPDSIPQMLMSEVVELTLDAMDAYPTRFQLQKNALLTLCNDRILQDAKMDRFRCAKLVLNTFCQFTSEDIERLCVAISSVVASKISSHETTEIGSQPHYMKKLLAIVRRKLRETAVDSTLGFALSTLWNLSDESPRTCSVFLDEGGMDLFTEMLRVYKDSEPILTKILGLLNNIAEVCTLRNSIMKKEIINSIRSLLQSDSIEISYFSAGVFAHLVSSGVGDWSVDEIPRHLVLQELENVVLSWKQADKEMVAYRSFRPFLPLLQCYETYQAQLWALWAIQHVLTAHAFRYYVMLTDEGICDILQLLTCLSVNVLVRQRARIILDQLNDFGKKKISSFKF